jgi:uncharacterized iron-regulated membrane protein
MSTVALVLVGLAAALALVSLGGGFYEILTIDRVWPGRPELVQPAQGGISVKRFWIPAHTAFELMLIAALVAGWGQYAVRTLLLVALVSHAVMRIWSAVDFIPKRLAFERATPGTVDPAAARRWSRRSLLRLPLDLVTCGALGLAVMQAARLA